jgi:integrase
MSVKTGHTEIGGYMVSRYTPISGSYQKIQGYPSKLKIYKIGASDNWQMRYYLDGRVIRKSSHTPDRNEAIKKAKEFWSNIALQHSNNLPITTSSSFERVALALIKHDQAQMDVAKKKTRKVEDEKHAIHKHLIPFFKEYTIKDVNYQIISEFASKLQKQEKAPATVIRILSYVSKVLKHAYKLNLITSLPLLPTIQKQDNPRPWFTSEQYEHLRDVTKELIKSKEILIEEKTKRQIGPITDQMRHLITFMVNTFLRPSDIKHLQHRHIEVVKTKKAKYLRITLSDGKTTLSPTVSMPFAVGIYEDLRKLNKGKTSPDDYVFFPELKGRNYALQQMRRNIDFIYNKANLKTDNVGQARTLYSLRHTSIMFRLIKGGNIDLLTLAKNSHTSVDMIERFYANHLTGEMNVERIQSGAQTSARK